MRPSRTRSELLRRPGAPALEILTAEPPNAAGSPLLFVHGAFTGAWCWQDRFLGAMAERGRHAVALSLRGHGGSEGRRNLRLATIEDFVGDLRAVIESLPQPPVLIGHSLGGYLVQLMLGVAHIRGMVLMSSLPPDGLALVGPRLAVTDPAFWAEGVLGSAGRSKSPAELAALDLLFGEGITAGERMRYARMMVPESPVALAQTHLPRWVLPAGATGIPTLVIQGARDRMIWEGTAMRTALYHGADSVTVANGSHLIMLDQGADETARHLEDWLSRRNL